jgi:hypothetical protein
MQDGHHEGSNFTWQLAWIQTRSFPVGLARKVDLYTAVWA